MTKRLDKTCQDYPEYLCDQCVEKGVSHKWAWRPVRNYTVNECGICHKKKAVAHSYDFANPVFFIDTE